MCRGHWQVEDKGCETRARANHWLAVTTKGWSPGLKGQGRGIMDINNPSPRKIRARAS